MADGDNPQARLSAQAGALVPPEALLLCPECQTFVRPGSLEAHLRQSHRIYQFRGVRRSFNSTFRVLLEALLTARPDTEAWHTLSAIAAEEQGSRADVFLAATLGQVLSRLDAEQHAAVIDGLGQLIGRTGATGLAVALASDAEILARRLALIVIAHLPQPIDRVLIQPLRGLLLDRRLPEESQFAALAAVLAGGTGADDPLTVELLQKLVSGLGKKRSIERLRRFEQVAGPSPVVENLCVQLEERLRMSCPRCPAQLRRPEMIEHLWQEHRLVLDGRRVREPWALIQEWVEAYAAGFHAAPGSEPPNPELLERSRELAQRLDPDQGPIRLQRLLLSQGVADAEARRALLAEAAEQHAACCPWCYGLVPIPREVPALILNQYRGRLSARGYSVEVSERGLRTSLEVRTPDTLLYQGRESHQFLTARSAMVFLAGPLVLLALAWAFGLVGNRGSPLGPVVLLLLAAAVVHVLAQWWWRPRVDVRQRSRNYAWTLLAPRLHRDSFRTDDSAFLAGLAQLSLEDGFAALRAPLLPDLVKRTENAVAGGAGPPGHLAALRRLAIEDAVARGADPVPLVVDQLARCFEGRLPLLFAEDLLSEWRTNWWTAGNLTRLRILLCDRAFEAGFEVRNLLDAGQTAPALGAVLDTAHVSGLAALRQLWSLRSSRPWDRCGESLSAFTLAADADRAGLLTRCPDLLLWQEEPTWPPVVGDDGMEPVRICFCVRGVMLQDVLFTEAPRVVEVVSKWPFNELVIGGRRFQSRGELDALALRMERWFRYAFSEFLPGLAKVETWQSPDRAAILRAWGAVPCPECHRHLLARVGQVGIALDEDRNVQNTGERGASAPC